MKQLKSLALAFLLVIVPLAQFAHAQQSGDPEMYVDYGRVEISLQCRQGDVDRRCRQ